MISKEETIPMTEGEVLNELQASKSMVANLTFRLIEQERMHKDEIYRMKAKIAELRAMQDIIRSNFDTLKKHGARRLTLKERITGIIKLPFGWS